jgi:hypothetical protein
MPGPRRKKPPKHNFPPLELPESLDPRFFMEWFEFGYHELVQYLVRHYRFAEYLDAHPGDEHNALD